MSEISPRTFGQWVAKLTVCAILGHAPLPLPWDSPATTTVCPRCWTAVPRTESHREEGHTDG